jgi:cellulose synthase (UDP-forming)
MPYLALLILTLLGLTIGIFSDQFAYNDAGQGKSVVLFWSLYNVVILLLALIAFVELPRQERHIADKPEKGIFTTQGGESVVWLVDMTKDTVRVR